jgi:hypothetical protein
VTHFPLRAALAAAVLGLGLARAAAQDPRVEPPRTPLDAFAAAQFEINVGSYELAAQYLKGLLAANPTEKDFLAIEDRYGVAALLNLRNVPRWSEDPKEQAETRKAVEDIIERAGAARRKLLGDPQRITRYIANLQGTPEERAYAIRELQRSGALAVPTMITTLTTNRDSQDRAAILNAMPWLYPDAVPPWLAALDMNDPVLKAQLLDSLAQRRDLPILAARPETDPTPTLDYLAASPNQSDSVRRKALELLTRLRPLSVSQMPSAKVELTKYADKYYRHQVRVPDLPNNPVWRWDGMQLVNTPSNPSQVEEYFGLRYARWALELDPTYEPAQVVFLSLATDKAFERGGLDKPLAVTAPEVHDLLDTADVPAMLTALDRALVEKRSPVALALVQALGERAEVQAGRSTQGKSPVLVRALDYPDRRVQLAAADALIHLPGPATHAAQFRVIEVLRRALAAESEVSLPTKPRVLIGHFNPDRGLDLARRVQAVGYDAIVVRTGWEVMRRLKEAADIDAVLIDSDLPYPTLPDLLASLRADIHLGLLPVRVMYTPPGGADSSLALRGLARLEYLIGGYSQVAILLAPVTTDALQKDLVPAKPLAVDGAVSPLTTAERKAQSARAIELLRQLAVGETLGYDVTPAERAIRQALVVNDLAKPAIAATGRLPGRDAQGDLATLVLDGARPVELRILAAEQLARHVQRFGGLLNAEQIGSLRALLPMTPEPELHGYVAAVVGSFRPDSRQTGSRFLRYFPPVPAAPAPPAPPAEAPKAEKPEKEDK